MKILVTGFDAFGEDKINPSNEVIKKLPNKIDNVEIIKLEVPTVFYKSAKVIQKVLIEEEPNYILSIGQAGGRAEITPERVAINVDDARIPDNEQQQPIDEEIQSKGESAYFSQLPIKAMVHYMNEENIPSSISNTAGTFVCNHIMYQTIFLTTTEYPNIKAGFMHIPFIPEQVIGRSNIPSMALEDIVRGTIAALKAIIEFDGKKDLKNIGGQTH